MKANLNDADPLRLRMIGAIFWASLFVYLIPMWFQHPVEFSPNNMAVTVSEMPSEAGEVASAKQAALSSTEPVAPEKSELFIDKPLTTQAPNHDPQRAEALSSPLLIKQARVDQQGRLSASSSEAKHNKTPPPSSADGHYWVQVATYQVESVALSTQQKLNKQGFSARLSTSKNKKGLVIYALSVGPYRTKSDANQVKLIVDSDYRARSVVIKK